MQRARPGALTFPFIPLLRCATEPVPVQGHMAHRGQCSSERCLHHRCNTRPGFSERTIQRLAVWEALVLFLMACLAGQIKQHSSFDRWPDSLRNLSQLLARLGFSHAKSRSFSYGGKHLYEASICLITDQRPLWALLHQSQPTAQVTFPTTWFSETSRHTAGYSYLSNELPRHS